MKALTERRDLIGGGLMVLIGAISAIYSVSNYSIGSLRMMGAGLFPTTLGVMLALLGLVIAFTGRNSRPGGARFELGRVILILGALAAFIFTARAFGMLPGVVVLISVSSLAARRLSALGLGILCLGMVVIAVGIFHLLFGLQMPLARWPF